MPGIRDLHSARHCATGFGNGRAITRWWNRCESLCRGRVRFVPRAQGRDLHNTTGRIGNSLEQDLEQESAGDRYWPDPGVRERQLLGGLREPQVPGNGIESGKTRSRPGADLSLEATLSADVGTPCAIATPGAQARPGKNPHMQRWNLPHVPQTALSSGHLCISACANLPRMLWQPP